jgi:hypothetical protein
MQRSKLENKIKLVILSVFTYKNHLTCKKHTNNESSTNYFQDKYIIKTKKY